MSTFSLSLLFISPLISIAVYILLREFRDPLRGYHEKYRKQILALHNEECGCAWKPSQSTTTIQVNSISPWRLVAKWWEMDFPYTIFDSNFNRKTFGN
jgi:hypothetical protein